MHDRKGRLIELGDHLKFKVYAPEGQLNTIGRVSTMYPSNKNCNVMAAYLVPGYQPVQVMTLTAGETEIVLKADGSEPVDALIEPLHPAEYAGHNA
jgi:hypothetical protein